MLRTLLALACAVLVSALDLPLAAPISTRIAAPDAATGGGAVLVATVTIPADAPPDLGCAAWTADAHGRWWQVQLPEVRGTGRHAVRVPLATALLLPVGHTAPWNPASAAGAGRAGLVFWSARSGGHVGVDGLEIEQSDAPSTRGHRLCDLRCGPATTRTGVRWELQVRPEPYPADPYDPDAFTLQLEDTPPAGPPRVVAGFHDQPMRASDRGDREELVPWGEARFAARIRATVPGRHRLRLVARWGDGARLECALPDLVAEGGAEDDIARVDADDRRFLSTGSGRLVWPVGPSLHSVWDPRGLERLGSKLTPGRGALSYAAYLDRIAAAGADATEIWLCSWNLALTWRGDWWPWHGAERPSEERAWEVEQVIDRAEARGIRVNLVVSNHGRASERTDHEWENNPANRAAGGWLDDAEHWFDDPRALAAQSRLRRYLAARYGDSPAILGWKMWSEVNLTELGHLAGGGEGGGRAMAARELLRGWHERAAADWAVQDPWRHPVTTHWSGDWHSPDRAIAGLPGIGYVCIDAYHGPEHGLWRVLCASTFDPQRGNDDGLAALGKPILVTEYGGNWDGAPPPRLAAEHAMGGWVALVSGHAGAPMLWWHEWVDQHGLFGPYHALRAFLAGEDLRGANRMCTIVRAVGTDRVWGRAWTGSGRMLGYVLDPRWGMSGGDGERIDDCRLLVGDAVRAGPMRVQWWDPDAGAIIGGARIDHPGGTLILAAPAFRRHLAFKLWREGAAGEAVSASAPVRRDPAATPPGP